MLNIIFILIIAVLLLIILYLYLHKSIASALQSNQVVETVKVTDMKIENSSTIKLDIDGEKLEKDLKEDYDTMVGRL